MTDRPRASNVSRLSISASVFSSSRKEIKPSLVIVTPELLSVPPVASTVKLSLTPFLFEPGKVS